PLGAYDPGKGAWIPGPNGVVLKVLNVVSGAAQVDVTGDGTPATGDQLAALGITSQELQKLGTLYGAGKTLWRVAISHFSTWDINWGWGPPIDADYPPV